MNLFIWKGIGGSIVKGAVELLLALPLLIVAAAYVLPGPRGFALWLLFLLLCYPAGFAGGSFLKLRNRYRLLLFAVFIGALMAFVPFGTGYGFYLGLPVGALLVSRGVKLVSVPWYVMFPVSFYAIGLICYFLGSLLFPLFPPFLPYRSLILWCGLVSLTVTLLMTNQSNMKQETLSGDKEPVLAAGVVWQNRILIGIVLILTVIFVGFRKLQQAVLWIKDQLAAWLSELLSRPSESPPAEKTEQQPMNLDGLGEAGEPAPWLKWLEQIFMIAVQAALIIAVLVLLYMAVKRLPKLLKKLISKLTDLLARKSLQKGAAGYEDSIESLMDWQTLRGQLTARMKTWLPRKPEPRIKWQDLTDNREKVRYLYRSWIQHAINGGYRAKRHLTPQEIKQDIQHWSKQQKPVPEPLVDLYEQVRYGGKSAGDADIELVKQSLEKKS